MYEVCAPGALLQIRPDKFAKALSKNRGLLVQSGFYRIPFLTWSVERHEHPPFLILVTFLLPCMM